MFVGAEFNVAATLLYCLVTFPVSLFDRQFEIQIYLVMFMHRVLLSKYVRDTLHRCLEVSAEIK